jgi:hypothetical protein
MEIMPIFGSGNTVTFIKRTVTGQDEYGDDVYVETQTAVSGCGISPGNSSEDIQGTASVMSDVIVHAPPDVSIGLFDAVILPDGRRYRLSGTSNTWVSPFTGTSSFQEIPLVMVTGAMEQFPRGSGGVA